MASQSYVMPMFVRLAVSNVEARKRWFQSVLGFETVFDIPGTMAHMRGERYQDVLIVKSDTAELAAGHGVTLSFTWIGSIDELAERVRATGGKVLDGPADRPWNSREVTIENPDGYRFSFSHPLDRGEPAAVSSAKYADE